MNLLSTVDGRAMANPAEQVRSEFSRVRARSRSWLAYCDAGIQRPHY